MKKNKAVSQPEVPVKSEPQTNRRGVSKQNVILITVVSFLIGFIVGATVAILKTQPMVKPISSSMTGSTGEESGKNITTNYEEEIRLSKSILEKDPRNLEALITLGNAYFDTDRYQEAIDAYSKALAIDPKNPDVRTDMGIMYRRLGQFDKALEAFRQAAQDQPLHVNSRFNIGIVLKYDKNDFVGAIQAWEEFLKLEAILDSDDQRPIMVKQEIESMKASLGNK
ncbi:MAG: tetratricopeptide repeat protein [Thermodesulfobacteriota bacterium]